MRRLNSIVALAAITVFFCDLLVAGTFVTSTADQSITQKYRIRASQFLHHATFGPRPGDVTTLATRMREIGRDAACEEWIEAQFAKPVRTHTGTAIAMLESDGYVRNEEGVGITRYRDYAWWHRSLSSDDQLRQRTAWALSQIFVVNQNGAGFNSFRDDESGNPAWLGLSKYYDMLLGESFGNYRSLLGKVTRHPIMGVFLSHLKNRKGDGQRFPDENYAREVMQLFSVGLYKLSLSGNIRTIDVDPDPNVEDLQPLTTYDNEDIKSFARVFTGYTYRGSAAFDFLAKRRNLNQSMAMYNPEHDMDPKRLLYGPLTPANQGGIADVDAALDNLFEHPSAGPFIARLLIQRLVRSNPSGSYIVRVARAFNGVDANGAYTNPRGDMKAVLKAILLDPQAWSGTRITTISPTEFTAETRSTDYSRLREPIVRYTSFLRAFRLSKSGNTYFQLPQLSGTFGQFAYRSPSVFNFYLPDFQPAGELLTYQPPAVPNGFIAAPEFEILDSVRTNTTANRFRVDVYGEAVDFRVASKADSNRRLRFDMNFEPEANRLPASPNPGSPGVESLLRHLDVMLCHGTMSDETKSILADVVDSYPNATQMDRAKAIILCVLNSADCAISE